MLKSLLSTIAFFVLILLAVSCGTPPATPATSATPVATETEPVATEIDPTSAGSSTPDACSLPQLEVEVQEVHRYMREFDDASTLAGSIPRDQLSSSIADLQRIRREAEDEQIPACLTNLRKIQVDHMNSVINSLLIFVRASDPQSFDCAEIGSTEEQAFCQSFALARQQHDEYAIELARLLGLTVVPAAAPSATSETAAPTP